MENRREIKEIANKYSELEEELTRFSSSEANVDLLKSDKKIIFSEDVIKKMIQTQNDTLINGDSNGFFIYGKEVSKGIIVFFKTTDSYFKKQICSFLSLGETFESLKMNLNIEIRNIKDIEKLHNQGIIDILNIEDLIDISLMGEKSLFEVLDNTLCRELPNGEKAIDSIIHFHTHNNISEYSTDYSIKDLLIYSYIFPSLIDSLYEINERTDINFYGTLMTPQRNNETEGIVRISTVESMKINNTDDLDFKFSMIPMLKISNDGNKLEKISSKELYKYTTYNDNTINVIGNGCYLLDVTNTIEGKDCLNKIKQYVKKTR